MANHHTLTKLIDKWMFMGELAAEGVTAGYAINDEKVMFSGPVWNGMDASTRTAEIAMVATVASFMVSYTRARAEAVGVSCKVGFMTRVPRVAIMIVGMLLDQVVIALVLIAATSLFTAFHRMVHVWRLTGGGAGGWGPPQEPFIAPVSAEPEPPEDPEA